MKYFQILSYRVCHQESVVRGCLLLLIWFGWTLIRCQLQWRQVVSISGSSFCSFGPVSRIWFNDLPLYSAVASKTILSILTCVDFLLWWFSSSSSTIISASPSSKYFWRPFGTPFRTLGLFRIFLLDVLTDFQQLGGCWTSSVVCVSRAVALHI